jgi:hypothetical protein
LTREGACGRYESVKKTVAPMLRSSDPDSFNPLVHSVAGAAAGGIAAACSNPLDVIKTRLQTQVMGLMLI